MRQNELFVLVDHIVDKDVFLYLGATVEHLRHNLVQRKIAVFMGLDQSKQDVEVGAYHALD